jgi:hypothetical protein
MLRRTAMLIISIFNVGNFCQAQDTPVNQLVFPEGRKHKIPFTWMKSKENQYSAMLIPIRLRGCPKIFYMQFDTGSPYSMLYRNKLKAIGKRYAQAVEVSDTAGKLQQFRFNVGNIAIQAKEIAVQQFDSANINWNKNAVEIIGTLGTDLIDNKVVFINYPEKYILITNNNGIEKSGLAWSNFIYEGRRILLPFSMQGEKRIAYFDTGSSAFELLTDKATAMQLASPDAIPDSQEVQSWGRLLKATSIQTTNSIEIASKKLPLRMITYIEGVNDTQINAMKKLGIGGMMGNRLFLNTILVIDTRNKKFFIM